MLRTLLALAALLAFVGCDDGGAGDDDDATDGVTNISISDLSPSLDQNDFLFSDPIWVEFAGAPDSGSLSLSTATGTLVAEGGEWSNGGTVLNLTPPDGLVPETAYVLTITWTPAEVASFSVNFSTSNVGNDVLDPPGLIGEVASLDLPGATFVEPAGLGPILAGFLEGTAVLVSLLPDSDFTEGAQPGLHMMGALGIVDAADNVTQDLCTESLNWTYGADQLPGGDDTPATFDNPYLRFGPADLVLTVAGTPARLFNASLSGLWSPDGALFVGGEFDAILDTRGLDDVVEEGAEEGSLCGLASDTLNVDCIACPNDNELLCLEVTAVDLNGERVEGMALETVACQDVIDGFNAGSCLVDDVTSYDDGTGNYVCP